MISPNPVWMRQTSLRACAAFFVLCVAWMVTGCHTSSSAPRYRETSTFVNNGETAVLRCVRPGDTLVALSRASGISFRELARLNELRPPYILRSGEYLFFPARHGDGCAFSVDYIREKRRQAEKGVLAAYHKTPRADMKVAVAQPRKPQPAPRRVETKTREPERKTSMLSRLKEKITGRTTRRKASVATAKRQSDVDLIWPLRRGSLVKRFSKDWRTHSAGVEIRAAEKSQVHAAAAGKVLFAGAMGSYERMVVIDHGQGCATLYAHTSKNLVQAGDRVRRDQVIALTAQAEATGIAPLRFEVRYDGVAVDPEKHLPPFEPGALASR